MKNKLQQKGSELVLCKKTFLEKKSEPAMKYCLAVFCEK